MSTWYIDFLQYISQRDAAMLGLVSLGICVFVALTLYGPQKEFHFKVKDFQQLTWLSVFLILAGVLLRLAWMWVSPFWYDESFTVLVSRLPFQGIIEATSHDTHPPAYYLLISWFARTQQAANLEILLRSASVVFFPLTFVVLSLILDELDFSNEQQLLSLTIFTFLPIEIFFGQEARMYALLQFAVLLAFLGAITRNYLGLMAATILMIYTHNFGLLLAFVFYGVAFMGEARRMWELWLSVLMIMIAYAPWGMILFGQMGTVAQGYWIQPVTLGGTLYALFQAIFFTSFPEWPLLLILAVIALGCVLAGAIYYGVQYKRWSLLAWAFGPLLLAVVMSLLWKPMLLWRGLFPCVPAFILLLSEGISKDKRAWAWAMPTAGVLLIGVVYLVMQNAQGLGKESPVILAQPGPGERVIHLNDETLLPYLVYRQDLDNRLLVSDCPAKSGGLHPNTRAALGIQTITRADLRAGDLLAAKVGPLSSKCEEDLYHELIAQSVKVALVEGHLTVNGVWLYGYR